MGYSTVESLLEDIHMYVIKRAEKIAVPPAGLTISEIREWIALENSGVKMGSSTSKIPSVFNFRNWN